MGHKKPKLSGVTGTALLTTVLLFPGCDLAKPKNAQQEIMDETTVGIVEQPEIASPPAARNDINQSKTVAEPAQKKSPVAQPLPAITRPSKSESPPEQTPELKPQLQLPPGWTQEKYQTLEQLRNEMPRRLPNSMYGSCENIDPILVGENIVFSNKWLQFIGSNKPLTRQQFEQWRDRIDIIYNCYVDLVGTTPKKGKKVFINASSNSDNGSAHALDNTITYNINYTRMKNRFEEIAKHNSWDYTAMHELGHVFANSRKWEIDIEVITELLVSYFMETILEAQYGAPGKSGVTLGARHRQRMYNRSLDDLRAGRIEAFDRGGVFQLYIHGLVDKVGWDTYKQVFRSYSDENFTPNKYEITWDKNGHFIGNPNARDFFDRIEYFSGKPGVLRTLPDKGALLDKYFNPQVVQRNLIPTATAQRSTSEQQMQYIQEQGK